MAENPSASPFSAEYGHPAACGGMTLRDWFAGQAPQPSDAKMQLERAVDRNRNPHNDAHKPAHRDDETIRAQLAYRYADAMLIARSKETDNG